MSLSFECRTGLGEKIGFQMMWTSLVLDVIDQEKRAKKEWSKWLFCEMKWSTE